MAATRQLRSNFEPGTSRWATRRAQWRALGLTDEDMEKPKIAIVNSSSGLAICFSHLDQIAKRAKRAIERAGGVAAEHPHDHRGVRIPAERVAPGPSLRHRGCLPGRRAPGEWAAQPPGAARPRALGRRPTIGLIRGSLAPGGGIVKLAVADDRTLEFAGPAVVFSSPAVALDAVRGGGQISRGEVVVLRGQGPIGSPGMGMASQLVFAWDGAGLTGHVAVVTDGQLSGLVNNGIVVGEVSPEAAAGGPLALVEDGDPVRIDVAGRVVDLDVPAGELERRRARLAGPPKSAERGWLSIYQRLVGPLPEGAVLTEAGRGDGGPDDSGTCSSHWSRV